MYLEPFFVEGLGHQSFLVGSDETHEAFVLDPQRAVAVYLEAARRGGLRLRYVLETHVHNDYVSGAKELAEAAGAQYVAAADAGLRFPYKAVRDGDELRLGELRVRALHTPGHTPEHLSYAVYDTTRSETWPSLVFTGGSLLAGAVGRPDLLGPALAQKLAPQLYDSLHNRLLPLGDGVLVLPTHGAGSLCGQGISRTRMSTIGYERLTNPALQQPDRAAFVRLVLSNNPGIPDYFQRMRPLNQAGPAPFAVPDARPLTPADVRAMQDGGAVVLDVRETADFGDGHIPGAVNVPDSPMLATWTGWLVPHTAPLVLVLERPEDWEPVTTALLRVGHERFAGYLGGGMAAWNEVGQPVTRIPQVTVGELARRRQESPGFQVLDVRTPREWDDGYIPGAVHAQLMSDLREQVTAAGLDPARPVATVCASGYRSGIAASLLQGWGFREVVNIQGGMTAWREAGLPEATPKAQPVGTR